MLKRMENQMEQLETALSGAIDRIKNVEEQLESFDKGRLQKPVVYVDEDTCLVSPEGAEIVFTKTEEK